MNLPRLMRVGSAAALLAMFVGCTDEAISTPSDEGATGTAQQALNGSADPDNPTGFDFDNGDIVADYIIPYIVPLMTAPGAVGPGDASIILNITTTMMAGWFDTIAPYSAKMVGIHSRIPRRPAAEGVNNRNRNIAAMHAAHRMLNVLLPAYKQQWRTMLTSKGINPDNDSMDLNTPAGIANYAAQAVLDARARDGMNRDGDETGRKYNRKMYEDYTGYEPVNSPFKLKDPSRWQPKIVTRGFGIFQVQTFVTPQWGLVTPYSFPKQHVKAKYRAPKPKASNFQGNRAAYKAQADEVLEASANLTDHQKMVAEFFDYKNQSLGRAGDFIRRRDGQSLEEWIQYDFLLQIAAFDGGIAIWNAKAHYDTVRPWTAIKHLYGKKKLRAWGGPGKGTVDDITGEEWESYLPVADHPEYPSGSSCFCAAHAQASRRWTGSDVFGWEIPRAAGSSVIEPGITPAQDLVIRFDTFTDWEEMCANSRVWGGVHFRSAIEEAAPICREIGDKAYEFLMPYINGTAE